MVFEKDAIKAGRGNVIVATIIFAILILLQIYVFSRPDFPAFMTGVTWILGALIGLLFLWQGIALLKSGGRWSITINQNGVNWISPNESVDQSFNVKLTEINKVLVREKPKKGKSKISKKYYLVLNNGTEQKLSPNSGINLVQVILELERLGVEIEHVLV